VQGGPRVDATYYYHHPSRPNRASSCFYELLLLLFSAYLKRYNDNIMVSVNWGVALYGRADARGRFGKPICNLSFFMHEKIRPPALLLRSSLFLTLSAVRRDLWYSRVC